MFRVAILNRVVVDNPEKSFELLRFRLVCRLIWDFDTARRFDAVNGVPAHGGAVNGYPEIVAGGVIYVNSGGSLLTHPGNVLLAFTVDGK